MEAVISDVVSGMAPELLDMRVVFTESNKAVENGVHLKLAESQTKPHVEITGGMCGGDEEKWALLMVDPDAPTPETAIAGNILHWMVLNIPGSTTNDQEIWRTGQEVTEYLAPAPRGGTHRYVILLFKQQGQLNVGKEAEDRIYFDVNEFAEKHSLGLATAGRYFYASKDDEAN